MKENDIKNLKKSVKGGDYKLTLADYLSKQSPLKSGVTVKNEDKALTKWDKISDRIYLGNFNAAADRKFLIDNKIKAVLNCTKDVPNYYANNRNIEYMRIPVDDSLKEKDFDLMYQYMPAICEFIYKHADIQKNKILVHCVAGRQRSAIAVAAYLVCKKKLNPHQACAYILSKRPEAFHYGLSLNFDQALDKYHKDLNKNKK